MTKDVKPDTWMPLVIGDYKKDTGRLTRDQHGGYLLLIMEYWCTGPLLDDDEELAAIVLADTKEWRRLRPKLERFFRIEDGRWRHKRIDKELEEWSARKQTYVARARAGGKAKAAKSSASSTLQADDKHAFSTPQAVLKGCTASSEVGSPSELPTLRAGDPSAARAVGAASGRRWQGPEAVREAFVLAKGEDWTATYLDPCQWQDVPDRALIPATGVAAAKIFREARRVLLAEGIALLERVA